MQFKTFMISCTERDDTRRATLESLRASGWPEEPEVVMDRGQGASVFERIGRTWRELVERAVRVEADFLLLLEDDVVFGNWFYENLLSWELLRDLPPGRAFYASLYNASRAYFVKRPLERYLVAHPGSTWGSQAIVTTPETLRYVLARWDNAGGGADQRMPRIASRVTPIYYHVPSLVNQAPVLSTWSGMSDPHSALDFDPDWRAPATAAALMDLRRTG